MRRTTIIASAALLSAVAWCAPAPPDSGAVQIRVPVWLAPGTDPSDVSGFRASIGGVSSKILSVKRPSDDLLLIIALDMTQDLTQATLAKQALAAEIANLPPNAVVAVMRAQDSLKVLAEPNLVAESGKEASFLAGGEYPYPVVQPQAGGGYSVTIQFKEFGVRLNFTPNILGGDLIHLKLRPEVSALDFNNAIILQGFRIPALSTRKTETEVELQDGQTFAIAGLLNNTATSAMRKVPGIGDIPIIGSLFKSRAYQKDQTELVVMVTPIILKRGSTGVSQGLPNIVEPFLGAPSKATPPPSPYSGSPRYGATGQGSEATIQPPQTPRPAPAATPAPVPYNGASPASAVPSGR